MVKFFSSVVFICVYSAAAVSATSPAWPALTGSFLIAKSEGFAPFPRTTTDDDLFTSEGWALADPSAGCTNGGLFNGFQYVKGGNDYSVGLLYDVNGIISGIQMLILKSVVLTPTNPVNYTGILMYQNATYGGNDYFVVTAYFVNPSTICDGGRTKADLNTQGTGTGVWIQNGGPTSTVQVPLNRADATAQGWAENQCFPGMGLHNFYQLDRYAPTNCAQMAPVFGLYNSQNKLHGFGLITVGNLTYPRFEHPPKTAIELILGPGKTPQCVLDVQERETITSLHVWFIEKPYFTTCSMWQWLGAYTSYGIEVLSDLAKRIVASG